MASDCKALSQVKMYEYFTCCLYTKLYIYVYCRSKSWSKVKLVKLKSLLSGSGDTTTKKGRGCTIVATRKKGVRGR